MNKKYTAVISCILVATLLVFFPVIASSESVPQDDLQSRQNMSKEKHVNEINLLVQKMKEYGFAETDLYNIRDLIRESGANEIPQDALVHKVYEGMAKNIKPDNILHATIQVQDRYRSALRHTHLFSDTQLDSGKLTKTIAQAFAAGLRNEDCERLVLELKEQIRDMNRIERNGLIEQTMWTARDMSRRQVHSSTIYNVLSSALRHSYQAKEMRELRQQFTTQTKRNAPENVAIKFLESIGRGVLARQLGEASATTNSSNSTDSSGGNSSSGGSSGGNGSSGGSSGGGSGSGGKNS